MNRFFKFLEDKIIKYQIDSMINRTKINKKMNIFEDRINELSEYYNTSNEDIENIFKGPQMHEVFKDKSTDDKLINAYIKRTKIATISHMLKYTRFEEAFYIIKFINTKFRTKDRKKIKVLDYGCSIADYGIVFALNFYKVWLCDIENGNIEVGKWRFQKRNLEYHTLPIKNKNLYPEFNDFTLVLAGEVLEHLRNPLLVMENIYNGLNRNGYFWTSGFPVVKPKIGEKHPDHLLEAAKMRDEVLNYTNINFSQIKLKKGFLFQKKL